MVYRVVFMGTPEFAVSPLRALVNSSEFAVVGVVTQPDRPAGRGKAIQPSPVKAAALELLPGVPIFQPEKLKEAYDGLEALQPDVFVVAAFGQILRQRALDMPKLGCINVHASLLPRWRGAAPIQAAIRAGDIETGITIMRMDAGLDTGPMILKQVVEITDTDTGESLHDKLAALGGEALIAALAPYLRGEMAAQPQPTENSTYAPVLKKEDGLIDWTMPAEDIERMVRAYHPWPGTYTTWAGQTVKILPRDADDQGNLPAVLPGDAAPGEVVARGPGMVAVGTVRGLYVPYRLQLAGRGAVGLGAFVNGHNDFVGARLGQ